MTLRSTLAALLTGAIYLPAVVDAQAPARQIQAKNGDLILVENADQVRVVRRREGNVRAIFNANQHWLVLLVDYRGSDVEPDGVVDEAYRYHAVFGEWPFGERWEGRGVVHNYWILGGEPGPRGVGLSTALGLIQLLGGGLEHALFKDASAVATLSYGGAGRGGDKGLSFEAAEQQQVRMTTRVPETSPSAAASFPKASSAYPAQAAAVRVGGNIRTPMKTHDVRPIYPDEALKARITGRVILEAVIGVDGTVADARVLKGIPILDAAAIDAVRQWRFEPTLLNGAAVPVIMTVTVSFNLK